MGALARGRADRRVRVRWLVAAGICVCVGALTLPPLAGSSGQPDRVETVRKLGPNFGITKAERRRGKAETIMWTTDLTHDYVTINADYRT